MKRLLVILSLISTLSSVYAATAEELSKQATAFYSDNNFHKTMELILQIDEKERSAQDWLILGNLLDEKGEKENAIFMYQKAINANPKYYKAYYNLANIYLNEERYNMAIDNYKQALKLNKEIDIMFINWKTQLLFQVSSSYID